MLFSLCYTKLEMKLNCQLTHGENLEFQSVYKLNYPSEKFRMEEVLGFVVTILALAIIGFIMYVLKKTMDSLVVLTNKIGTRTKHLTAKTMKMFKSTGFFQIQTK